jgi:protein phosphatase-4 regulatory subunit 3
LKEFINHCMGKYETELRLLAETPLGGPRFMLFIRRWEMNNEPPPKEEKIEKPDLRIPGQSRLMEAEEENYFNTDDDDTDIIPPIASPIFPRGQAPSPPLNSLKRKRRTGLNISTAFRPTLTPPRTPPIGSLVDYDDDDDDDDLGRLTSVDTDTLTSAPLRRDAALQNQPSTDSPDLLSSPRLSKRQIHNSIPPQRPSLDDDEDNLLEALVRSKSNSPLPSIATPKTPDLGLGPMRPSEKRQREDDDDELLERLASKAKRPDFRAAKVLAVSSGGRGSKPGDDPPKKIKLKFGLTSLGTASTSPFSAAPSEAGVKDGDTG